MTPTEALVAVLGAAAVDLTGVTTRWAFGPIESAVTWMHGDPANTTGFAHVKTALLIDMGFIAAEDVTA